MNELTVPSRFAVAAASTSPLDQPMLDPETRAAAVLRMAQQGRRSVNTQRAYAGDLRRFFEWCGRDVTPKALLELCGLDEPALAVLLSQYAEALKGRGLAPASINRPLAAIRTLLTLARRKGKLTKVDVVGLVDNEPAQKVRDTRGPSLTEMKAIMKYLQERRTTLTGKRDWLIWRLLWQHAFRRDEIEQLNIESYEPRAKLLTVHRKGGKIRQVKINSRIVSAIDLYLAERTGGLRLNTGEPLILNVTSNRVGRLTGNGIRTITNRIGKRVIGRPVNPHAVRHSCAKVHYDLTKDIVATKNLLGHDSAQTTELYLDDDEQEQQGVASDLLSKTA